MSADKFELHITLAELADLAQLAIGGHPIDLEGNDPETEIVIRKNVTLNNEDGTCTTWPLAFYFVDCPEEGFCGIGDDPGAVPIKEPASTELNKQPAFDDSLPFHPDD